MIPILVGDLGDRWDTISSGGAIGWPVSIILGVIILALVLKFGEFDSPKNNKKGK